MRTQGAFYADTPHGGGIITLDAVDINYTGGTFNKLAAGNFSLRYTTATTPVSLVGSLNSIKRLTLVEDTLLGAASPASLPFQEQFGNASGATGYPAGAAGLPPFTGASQLTQPTAMAPKGIRVYAVSVAYQLATNALSAHTVAVYRNTITDGATLTQSVLLAPTALGTAVTTNIHVVKTAIATPVFETVDGADLVVEVLVTPTASAPTYDFYWINLYCDFNYD